jgi:alkylation response protein AidB-like acyl-CoA dehydrogenase
MLTGMATTLERVKELQPRIRELEGEITEKRRLPTDLVEDLRGAGVFRMAMPKSWGGPELPLLDQLEVVEALSYANGSVGWCAMIGCDSGYYSAWLDDAVGREVFALDSIAAGLTQPGNNATKVDGGYRVTGRWKFGSGVTHADVVLGGAFILDEAGEMLPSDVEGIPLWRTLVLPRDAVEVIDVWYTTGLEGSGSNDYAVTDAFVPDEHAMYIFDPPKRESPLYSFFNVITKVAAVPLGIARRVIDETIALAPSKLALPSFVLISEEVRTHDALGRAEAMVSSARGFLRDTVGELWNTLIRGDESTPRQRALVRLAMQNAAHSSRDAIALLYDTMTTSAVYQPNAIDQALRDVTTICQHVTLNSRARITAGRVLLGLDAQDLLFN